MSTKAYMLLYIQEDTNEFVAPQTCGDKVLMLAKADLKGTTQSVAGHWKKDSDRGKAQLTPIPVQCPMCSQDAELWWLRDYYYSQHFVVCDGECNVAIQLQGCDG